MPNRDRKECPEYNCPHEWTREEMVAHLQWDHNRSEHRAEKLADEVFTS